MDRRLPPAGVLSARSPGRSGLPRYRTNYSRTDTITDDDQMSDEHGPTETTNGATTNEGAPERATDSPRRSARSSSAGASGSANTRPNWRNCSSPSSPDRA
ncbi:hypothetical protein D8S78_14700 [Natrialba swarupiae]|nr:hypothetical protein [Natrialba swarupiae]